MIRAKKARFSHFLGILVCLSGCARLLVVVDPGHTDADSGTWSSTARREVEYNDRLAGLLAERLRRDKIEVLVTRAPHLEIELRRRAEMANEAGARIFVSIHHDAAQSRYQKETVEGARQRATTTTPLRGHSLFVSKENGMPGESQRLARALAEELLALGRPPTLHHAEMIPGESRTLLDKRLGVYEYTGLAVLRRTKMPAVLVEAGVVTDPVDERFVTANAEALAEALYRGIRKFLNVP